MGKKICIMKKLIAAVLCLVVAAMVFTGCSADEIAFYNTVKSMNALTSYAYSGTMSVKIPTLEVNPALSSSSSSSTSSTTSSSASSSPSTTSSPVSSGSGQDTTAQTLELYREMLNNATLAYSGVVDSKNKKVTLNVNVTLGNGTTLPINCILQSKSGKSVLDISPLAAALLPASLPYTAVTISGTQYDEYNLDSIIAQLSAQSGTASGAANSTLLAALQSLSAVTKTSSAQQQDMQKKSQTFSDNLINSFFKKFSPGLVKKSGANTYTCSLTLKTALTALTNTLAFVGKNTAAFKTLLVNYGNGLTDSEVAGLNISGIKTKKAFVTELKAIDLSSLSGLSSAITGELGASISALTLNMNFKLAKASSKSYKITDSVALDNTKQPTSAYFINLSVSQSTTITG
jgi:hypothetical protein